MVLKELLTVDREWESLTSVSRRVILICTLLLVFMVVGVSSAANVGDVVSNSIGMKLVWIPPGEFMMGSDNGAPNEKPVHRVKISKGFWVGQTEVTQAQYRAITDKVPGKWKGDNLPANHVNWDEAMEFCRKLSQKEGLTYTLPTEAQWEYACRAGTKTAFSFGDSESKLKDYAWYGKSLSFPDNLEGKTDSVGQKKPNAFGLYDTHGNVTEWCSDWYDGDYYKNSPEVDPTGPDSGDFRVIRGGSWVGHARSCQSSFRGRLQPDWRLNSVGFRVVLLAAGCGNIIEEACKTADGGFKPIFNGKDLSEWEGDPQYAQFWSVQDGTITGQNTGNLNKTIFLFWRGGDVDDFELRLSYRTEFEQGAGNSGIQFRSRKTDDWGAVGYQADIEHGATLTGALYDEHGRGLLAKRGQKVVIDEDGNMQATSIGDPAELFKQVKPDNWNKYQIIARGNELTLKINGALMSQVIDKQKGESDSSGAFALQIHAGPPMKVQFKDILLKKLTD